MSDGENWSKAGCTEMARADKQWRLRADGYFRTGNSVAWQKFYFHHARSKKGGTGHVLSKGVSARGRMENNFCAREPTEK